MSDRKRLKLPNSSALRFIPVAYSFSEIETSSEFGDGATFSPHDCGDAASNMYDEMEHDLLILQILYNLDDKEKIVFLYLLLRDYGHKIDFDSLAKTVGYKRSNYMHLVKKVRTKAALVLRRESNKQHGKAID